MFDSMLMGAEPIKLPMTLFTDAFMIKGTVRTRRTRITDILNSAEDEFIVLEDAMVDEYGTRTQAVRTEFAQVNLDAVLFAVSDTTVEPRPDLRTPKVSEQALISIPPFRIIGSIHVLPERDLHDALRSLTGRFIPVSDATYWSETVGEARTTAAIVAFNHRRAQILAPHRAVDPWAGLDRSGETGSATSQGADGARDG
jgi:hypothetical protein